MTSRYTFPQPPPGQETRGFAFYVGVGPGLDRDHGYDLGELRRALSAEVSARVPHAESRSVLLLPAEIGTDDDGADAVIDFARSRVLIDGSPAHLTYRQFGLLHALARRDGVPLRRSELKAAIAGDPTPITDRAIDVQIRRVRAKLGIHSGLIETVRGYGYRFVRIPGVRVVWH